MCPACNGAGFVTDKAAGLHYECSVCVDERWADDELESESSPHGAYGQSVVMQKPSAFKRLIITNLPSETPVSELRQMFEANGFVTDTILLGVHTRDSGSALAVVDMGSEVDAERAVDDLNGFEIGGRQNAVLSIRQVSALFDVLTRFGLDSGI